MHLKAVLIRFFRSYNYEYLRKHNQKTKKLPWEMIDETWFPYVRVLVEPKTGVLTDFASFSRDIEALQYAPLNSVQVTADG